MLQSFAVCDCMTDKINVGRSRGRSQEVLPLPNAALVFAHWEILWFNELIWPKMRHFFFSFVCRASFWPAQLPELPAAKVAVLVQGRGEAEPSGPVWVRSSCCQTGSRYSSWSVTSVVLRKKRCSLPHRGDAYTRSPCGLRMAWERGGGARW